MNQSTGSALLPVSVQPVVSVQPPAMGESTEAERGDVPGWVLITLMTAGLVVVIWGLAGPALSGVFERAIESVSGL